MERNKKIKNIRINIEYLIYNLNLISVDKYI